MTNHDNAMRLARAVGSAQASLIYIRVLARWPGITTMEEIIAETQEAEAQIARILAGEEASARLNRESCS